MADVPTHLLPLDAGGDALLARVIAAAREISLHDDPAEMMRLAATFAQRTAHMGRSIAVTRRGLEAPAFRVMRSPLLGEDVDPFRDADQLPTLQGGLLADLLYAGQAKLIDDLTVAPDDPAGRHLAGMRSLAAIPQFERGEALDMVFHLHPEPRAFDAHRFAEMALLSSVFGQAVSRAARARELREAEQSIKEQYDIIARVSNTVLDEAMNLKDRKERLEVRVRQRTEELAEAHLDTIYMLAIASEAKDHDTGAHLRRIHRLTQLLARELSFDEHDAETLAYAAVLHDVGKIHVPDHILKKPGPLTDEEKRAMQEHTVAGERILGSKPFFAAARRIARSHHENFDGTGYPDRTAGADIPVEARIVHLADVYDALLSPRVYKPAWEKPRAVRFIRDASRTMFDPEVTRAFDSLLARNALIGENGGEDESATDGAQMNADQEQ